MRQLKTKAFLAFQASGRLLLFKQLQLPESHDLTTQQRLILIGISIGLTIVAGLMSGLTLGLMSLDQVELEVLKRSGSRKEQKYAAAIAPLVSNAHFLLVTLLLCNACAMEALPLVLDSLADPVTAIVISVTAVLVFGEVLPQAVCSRYGLAIGYYCSWLVRAVMLLTCPISWPIGKLLDAILGKEHTALYRRGQLKALVDLHGADEGLGGTLLEEEIKVMCGALDLTHKTARMSLTPLSKVFMLAAESDFDQATLDAVLESGHSRIPVHAGTNKHNIIGLILVKDLLRHKPDQGTKVGDMKMRPLPRMSADTPMYDMFKLFQTGRSHMVVLTETPNTAAAVPAAAAAAAEGPPIGIITIEDVIEELMQTEIIDETDLFVDNERSIAVSAAHLIQALPAQLRLALLAQPQQHSNTTAAPADAAAAVDAAVSPAAVAAAAVQTVRNIIRQSSGRSRERGSSGGGAAAAAVTVGSGGLVMRVCDDQLTQPLLATHDRGPA